jgi:hypothetical protein
MRMKPSIGLELSCVGAVLIIVMLLAMWADGPGRACVLAREPRTVLVLSRQVDREHLATDLSAAGRIAVRHSRSVPDGEQQRLVFAECQASLVQQIASRHSLERSQLKPVPAVGQ